MAALGNLGRLFGATPATSAKSEVQESLYDTTAIPPEVLVKVKGLSDAHKDVADKRELLIAHFRTVLGAGLFK
jgi:hypothetical protein